MNVETLLKFSFLPMDLWLSLYIPNKNFYQQYWQSKMATIDFNFNKPTISMGILEFLSENQKENPDVNRDVVK